MVIVMVFVPLIGLSNPFAMEVVNEFQTATSDSQRIEFRYLQSPASDTLFDDQPLLNGEVITPAGTSVIDTAITLPGCGYAVIDTSVLNGPFGLPGDTGFINTYLPLSLDSICYPCSSFSWKHLVIPAPPADASAAKYHCWEYDSWEGYFAITDWYIDYTPTFGFDNDDYPGCSISGSVYESGSGSPIIGAMVGAVLPPYYEIRGYEPYYLACTTYTQSDGSFTLDSLLPLPYYINVFASGYQMKSDSTHALRALRPLTNFNFYLVGIEEDNRMQSLNAKKQKMEVYPNPFLERTEIILMMQDAGYRIHDTGYTIKDVGQTFRFAIYDVIGRMVRDFSRLTTNGERSTILWDGTDDSGHRLPAGVYFVFTQGIRVRVVKL
jgi:hypothetical protein